MRLEVGHAVAGQGADQKRGGERPALVEGLHHVEQRFALDEIDLVEGEQRLRRRLFRARR
jgi:hypothetical protein